MCGYEELRLLDTDEVFGMCLQVLRSPRAATRPCLWKVGLGESRAGPRRGLRTTGRESWDLRSQCGLGMRKVGGEGQEDGKGDGLQVGTPVWP